MTVRILIGGNNGDASLYDLRQIRVLRRPPPQQVARHVGTEVVEVPSSDQAVAAVVARADQHQYGALRHHAERHPDLLRHCQAGVLHQNRGRHACRRRTFL
jgi:hypothetical protein